MIKIENLTVKYEDGTTPLKDVSFSAAAGERIAILGDNGAGKTSLFMAMVGILKAETGTIKITDVPVDKENLLTIRRRVGLVFQNPDDQLFMPNIYDDIAFGPRNYGHSEEEVNEKVTAVLEELEISHLKDRSSLKLSGGEKRIATIAAVLVMRPKVLLFDEPTAFLDNKSKKRFAEILETLPQTRILATHDLELAKKTSDRIIIMDKGRIIYDGPTCKLDDENPQQDTGYR
ncbi:MAG: energy-coupling factor ABC transporter ATP-binding protein [Clostridiales Family XIII bacterium]|jgi:cobalt/nickel transport system ATP-binding protein|nr:energy-coupling factor ABC transporter ATP-binding protein [Clostridiales Family XIII bacterium]